MKKQTTLAAMMAALLGAAVTAPTVAPDVQPAGINQQTERTATNQNRNTPARVVPIHRQNVALQNMDLPDYLLPRQFPGLSPKDYGLYLQRTGRQWTNMRERRSRKYRG